MAAQLVHRGPDDGGLHVDPSGVAIGARRLSVIDVAGGHQPLANEDGTVWAALNGEIYNYPQLRRELLRNGHELATHCDTEALVHLYEDFGADLVHALEGMYAFVVWDARRNELVLARDRFGEKPLFYATNGDELAFASELCALAPGGELDPLAIEALLTLGYVPAPRTMYGAVRQLAAGHVLRWSLSERRAHATRYWEMPPSGEGGATPVQELVDEAQDLLDRAVASRLVADVPVGVLLSGGVDSTLIAALARGRSARLTTFTVAYDSGAVNEDTPARSTARLVDSEHHELRLTAGWIAEHVPALLGQIDQPIADPALVALAAISRRAREHVKVAVGGEGADELFFGYPRYRWLGRAERLGAVVPATAGAAAAAQVAGRVASDGRAARVADVLRPASGLERNLRWVTEGRIGDGRDGFYGPRLQESAALLELVGERWSNGGGAALAAARLDQRLYLCDDILQKADRASMLASLELRTPYLDRALAEFSATVAPALHMAGGGKNLLRRVLRRTLPAAAAGRKKTAFRVPLADWLRGPLAPSVAEHVLAGRLVEDGWVRRDAARRAVDALATQDAPARELWAMLCVGAWLDARG